MSKNKSRRKILTTFLLGIVGLLSTLWIFRRSIMMRLYYHGNFDTKLLTTAPQENEVCVLSSTQVRGPYHYPSPKRSDVRDNRKGQELEFKLQILRYPACEPIKDAMIEIWHCDAEGNYSGYPEEISHDIWKATRFIEKSKSEGRIVEENGSRYIAPMSEDRYLRGHQMTDEQGWVVFNTIFPGWYVGRVPHIHIKVMINDEEQLTTQFYFEQNICDQIYTSQAPYNNHGKCPVVFEKDVMLENFGDAKGLLLKVGPITDPPQPLKAFAKIGIKTA